jgi:hypothetical protein
MLQYQADGMEYLHDLNKKLSVQALKDLFKDMMDAEIVSYYDQGIRSITDLWPFLTQCQKLVYNNFLVLNSIIDQSDAETVYHLIVDSLINFGVTECDLKIIGGNSFYLYCNNYNVLEVVKFLDQMGLIVQMCQENLTDENTPYYWTGLIDVDGYVKTLVIGSWDFADEITIVKRTSSSASNRSVAPSGIKPSVVRLPSLRK